MSGALKKSKHTGAFLTSASKDGTVKIWDAEYKKDLACISNSSPVKPTFAWTSENYFAYGDRDGFVHVFEVIYKR